MKDFHKVNLQLLAVTQTTQLEGLSVENKTFYDVRHLLLWFMTSSHRRSLSPRTVVRPSSSVSSLLSPRL